jgi:polysaccharide biosynthesis/export protein
MRAITYKAAIVVPLVATPPMSLAGKQPLKGGSGDSSRPSAVSDVANNFSTHVIGPADALEVNVWKESDVSRAVGVRPDGKISLTSSHDIQVAGMTPRAPAKNIQEALDYYVREFAPDW